MLIVVSLVASVPGAAWEMHAAGKMRQAERSRPLYLHLYSL